MNKLQSLLAEVEDLLNQDKNMLMLAKEGSIVGTDVSELLSRILKALKASQKLAEEMEKLLPPTDFIVPVMTRKHIDKALKEYRSEL